MYVLKRLLSGLLLASLVLSAGCTGKLGQLGQWLQPPKLMSMTPMSCNNQPGFWINQHDALALSIWTDTISALLQLGQEQ